MWKLRTSLYYKIPFYLLEILKKQTVTDPLSLSCRKFYRKYWKYENELIKLEWREILVKVEEASAQFLLATIFMGIL